MPLRHSAEHELLGTAHFSRLEARQRTASAAAQGACTGAAEMGILSEVNFRKKNWGVELGVEYGGILANPSEILHGQNLTIIWWWSVGKRSSHPTAACLHILQGSLGPAARYHSSAAFRRLAG